MAPLTWKLLLGTSTLSTGQHCSANDSCEDQTALLQSHLASHKSSLANAEQQGNMLNFPKMAALSDPNNRKTALAQFEHTALELAQNKAGVTDEVVEICRVTTELLTDTVLAAISSEHSTDQASLDSIAANFGPIEDTRAGYEAQILGATQALGLEWTVTGWVADGSGLIGDLRTCTTTVSETCTPCITCTQTCAQHHSECVADNLALEEAHNEVIETITIPASCDGNGDIIPPSTTVYNVQYPDYESHGTNKVKMEEYLRLLALYEQCEECDPVNLPDSQACQCPQPPHECDDCDSYRQEYTACNTKKAEVDAAACQARYDVSEFLALYHAAFGGQVTNLNEETARVMIAEADRKVEWDTLERVICLLNVLTIDEDGAASSTTTEARIDACRADTIPEVSFDDQGNGVLGTGAHTGHLDINYPVGPDPNDLPSLPASPCSEVWTGIVFPGGPPVECGGVTNWNDIIGGQVDEPDCVCDAAAPDIVGVGFPFDLGPFLMFDTGFEFSASGFQANVANSEWTAQWGGQAYTGLLSPFADVTLPQLDIAFDLSEDNTVARVAWAYASSAGTAAINALAAGANYEGEAMQERFIRTGGFVYLNSAGTVVALKEISPSQSLLGQDPQLSLVFEAPVDITETVANTACPNMQDPDSTALDGEGAEEYCWHKSSSIIVDGEDICVDGCFVYKGTEVSLIDVSTTFWKAFAVKEAPLWNGPDNYAGTDQQGAVIASMITGRMARTSDDPGVTVSETVPADSD